MIDEKQFLHLLVYRCAAEPLAKEVAIKNVAAKLPVGNRLKSSLFLQRYGAANRSVLGEQKFRR